jgi:hypothetical protein
MQEDGELVSVITFLTKIMDNLAQNSCLIQKSAYRGLDLILTMKALKV